MLTIAPWWSFVTEGFDGTQPCGTARRVDAEEETDGERDTERQHDRVRLHERLHADDLELAPDQSGDDPEDPAEHAQQHRLDEELHQDVAPARADRLADADLARPLGDAHEHDV